MDSQLIIPKESKANLSTTWKIYKSQWKTFISVSGFVLLAWIIFSIIDILLNVFGLVPFSALLYTDYESFGTGALLASFALRTPILLVYVVVISFLYVLYLVIPALYFKNKEIITWKVPYIALKKNFKRYFLAGLLYTLCVSLGYMLCVIPGLAISFIAPAYVNKIACTDMPIKEAFTSSFQSVFKSPNLWSYLGMQILAGLIYSIPTLCTCGIGFIITFPMLSIYSLHLAYNKGIIN